MIKYVYKVLFLTFLFVFVAGFQKIEARCLDTKPDHAPDLFQIDTTETTATLYFTPVNNAVSYYFIRYGFTKYDDRFGVSFNQGSYDGVLSYTINALSPNTKYYFNVRAGNGCAVGKWSNTLTVITRNNYSTAIEIPGITSPTEENVAGVQTTSAPVKPAFNSNQDSDSFLVKSTQKNSFLQKVLEKIITFLDVITRKG